MELRLTPDLNVPYAALLDRPQWARAYARTATVGTYIQHWLGDAAHAFANAEHPDGIGENSYPQLVAIDWGRQLQKPLHCEAGILKDWSRDGAKAAEGIISAIGRARAIGVEFASVGIDEPLIAAKAIGMPFDQVPPIVSRAMRTIQEPTGFQN